MKPIHEQRDKHFVTYRSERMTLCKACRMSGVRYSTAFASMIGDVSPQESFDFHLARMQEKDKLNNEGKNND
jgi:hypothetical protein